MFVLKERDLSCYLQLLLRLIYFTVERKAGCKYVTYNK